MSERLVGFFLFYREICIHLIIFLILGTFLTIFFKVKKVLFSSIHDENYFDIIVYTSVLYFLIFLFLDCNFVCDTKLPLNIKVIPIFLTFLYLIYLATFPNISLSYREESPSLGHNAHFRYKDVYFNINFVLIPLKLNFHKIKDNYLLFRYISKTEKYALIESEKNFLNLGEIIILTVMLRKHPISVFWFPEIFLTFVVSFFPIHKLNFLVYLITVIFAAGLKVIFLDKAVTKNRFFLQELLEISSTQHVGSFIRIEYDTIKEILTEGVKPAIWKKFREYIPF